MEIPHCHTTSYKSDFHRAGVCFKGHISRWRILVGYAVKMPQIQSTVLAEIASLEIADGKKKKKKKGRFQAPKLLPKYIS